MAGSITITSSRIDGVVTKYSVAWLSDASGDVNANTFTIHAGTLLSVVFTPDSGGTQPTNLYDVTVLDADSVNIIDNGAGTSLGANLSNAAASRSVPAIGTAQLYTRPWLPSGLLQPVVTNAGNAKGGTIDLYIWRGVL